jgi:micrococcal nuclease
MKCIASLTGLAVVLAAATLLAAPPVIEQLTGKVVGVSDGDTITVLVGKQQLKVRLEGIDAPESGQSFGRKAKDALAALVAGKNVSVRKTGDDQYGRTLGVVIVDGVDVNAKLVEDGWAWHFKKYSTDARLAKLEVEARKARRGLWADAMPLSPWEYRARQRTPMTAAALPADGSDVFWLNTSSGVRHNSRCEHFSKTKRGRFCSASDGKPCGICGG